uniref:Uncharacterized protein n=1 Tax=Lepeophtheirus salmonis TaxID=72036 RepID=A0A0K2U8T9_LEPSM
MLLGPGNKTFLKDGADVHLGVDLHPSRYKHQGGLSFLSHGRPNHHRLWLLFSVRSMITQITIFGQNTIILGVKSLFHTGNLIITERNVGSRVSP